MDQPIKTALKKVEEGYTFISILNVCLPHLFVPDFLFLFFFPFPAIFSLPLTSRLSKISISFLCLSQYHIANNSLFHIYLGIINFFFLLPFLPPLLFIPSVFLVFPLYLTGLLHTAMVPPEASSLNDGGLVIFGASMNTTSIMAAGIMPWHLDETSSCMEKMR